MCPTRAHFDESVLHSSVRPVMPFGQAARRNCLVPRLIDVSPVALYLLWPTFGLQAGCYETTDVGFFGKSDEGVGPLSRISQLRPHATYRVICST